MAVRIRRGKGRPVVVGGEDDSSGSVANVPQKGVKRGRGGRAGSQQPSLDFGEPVAKGTAAPRAKSQTAKSKGSAETKTKTKTKTKSKQAAGKTAGQKATPSTSKKTTPKKTKKSRKDASSQAPARKAASGKSPAKKSRNSVKPALSDGRRATAESMAGSQREISVSEFFTKNRHLLGFDSPARALLTTVKEAVDNSLDACEEAGILPTIRVEIYEVREDRYRVMVEDNGPGIVKAQIPKVFGKLLYGSKFHRLRQSRGQQGIGISAAGMYGQLTTGKPVIIASKTGKGQPAHLFEIVIDTRTNTPIISKDETIDWDRDHGTRIELELEGTYKAGRRSVDEYLEQVAIANPHAEIRYMPPRGRSMLDLPRATDVLPAEPAEIKPHPYGVELGSLQRILKETKARTLSLALQTEFSRVTAGVAEKLIDLAGLKARTGPSRLTHGEVERLHHVIPKVKIFAPPTNCVVPIGTDLLLKGMQREITAEFYATALRPPAVYRGNPFQVEVGLAYGGALRAHVAEEDSLHETGKAVEAAQGPITLLRMANRVPLQYQQSACATFKAVSETNWRQYGLPHPKGGLPQGSMVLLVHIASVWVPFTSESKEAVAHYAEILKEIRLALQEAGRKLGTFLRKRERARNEQRRRGIFKMYIGELVQSLGNLTPINRRELQKQLMSMAVASTGQLENDVDLEAAVSASHRVEATDEEEQEGSE